MPDRKPKEELKFSFKKLWKYMGPGWLMSVGYLDPGNLESDLQTGVVSGYNLLWLLFWSHAIGFVFQLLSAKLGIVTGRHLSQLIRQHYTTPMANTLWACVQLALVAADALQVLGTSIALHLLLNLPLVTCVLLTSLDVLTFTLVQRYTLQRLETFFMILILLMAVGFGLELCQSVPDSYQILRGLVVPSIPRNAEFQAVAIVGAVVVPHNLFLHSALVAKETENQAEAYFYFSIESLVALSASFFVNLAIVIVFSQVFYKDAVSNLPGLSDADTVLVKTLGFTAKYFWAVGLLAAGQSSGMTGSLAGKYVTEGFFGHVFVKDWQRVMIVRALSILCNAMIALFAIDYLDTLGEMLNALQSLCLPIILIPIMKLSLSVYPKEFKVSPWLLSICWCLIVIVVGLNFYLFIQHDLVLRAACLVNTAAFVYIVFLLYIVWKPLEKDRGNEWMVLSQIDEGV